MVFNVNTTFHAPKNVEPSLRAPRRMRLRVDTPFVAPLFGAPKGAHFPLSTPLPVRHRRTYLRVDRSFWCAPSKSWWRIYCCLAYRRACPIVIDCFVDPFAHFFAIYPGKRCLSLLCVLCFQFLVCSWSGFSLLVGFEIEMCWPSLLRLLSAPHAILPLSRSAGEGCFLETVVVSLLI